MQAGRFEVLDGVHILYVLVIGIVHDPRVSFCKESEFVYWEIHNIFHYSLVFSIAYVAGVTISE